MLIYNSLSQTSFNYIYSSPLSEISRSILEDHDGNLYFSIENFQYGLIIKLNNAGKFLDSLRIDNSDGTCNLAELIPFSETQFVALGTWSEDSLSQLWYVRFDYDLNIIEERKLNTEGQFIFSFRHIVNQNNNIVLMAHYHKPPAYNMDVCMFELTLEGVLIRSMYFNTSSSFNSGFSVLEDPKNCTYKVFAKSGLSSRLPYIINVIDTSFNLLYTHYLPYFFIESPGSTKWINDSVYTLSGRRYSLATSEWDIGILKVNRNDSVLASNYFGKPDTVDWSGNYKSHDFISKDNIYLAGSSNTYAYPYQQEYSWIMLNVLDSNLGLKHQHFYGGDAFYLVNTILATQDSGCVLSCSRYDYLTQYNEFDVYILKVNKDGLMVSVPEEGALDDPQCRIFPNPGLETVTIVTDDPSQFQLFDLTGRIMFDISLTDKHNLVNVSGLKSGVYLYRMLGKDSIISCSGKWIKQ